MKRVGTLIMALCLFLALFTVSAFANGTSYYLEELDMSISIPEGFDVFTRDTKSNDPLLDKYGMSEQDLDYMYERNFYLDAYDLSNDLELVVTMDEASLDDYNNFSDSLMDTMLSELPAEYESNGVHFIKGSVCDHSQTKFVRIHISQQDGTNTIYSLQYNTVLDGMGINITLHSYSGKIGSAEEALAAEIVDSVSFGSVPRVSSQNTSAFVFTDEVSGLSFTVPENWREDPDFKDETNAGTRFVSKYVDAPYITYYRKDVYESNLGFAKDLVTRDMFGNDLFTAEDVAEMFSCDESDVSLRSFGDREYYFAEAVFSDPFDEIEADYTTIYLMRCENGIAYIFHFFDDNTSPYFDDFASLVSSCEYPEFDIVETDAESAYLVIGIILIAVHILTPAIYPLPIIIYRFAIRKKPVSKKKARVIALIYGLCFAAIPAFMAILTIGTFWILSAVLIVMIAINYAILKCGKAKEEPSPVIADAFVEPKLTPNGFRLQYCHICGNKLIEGSAFCNKCGTRIN